MDLSNVVTLAEGAAPSVAFLPFLIPALVGLAGTVIGGAMKNSAAAAQADKQYANDVETAKMQRAWNIEDRDEAREYSRKVYSQLVEDAEAAGFNPLTALRNGGGSAYNAAAAFAPLSREAPRRMAPDQSGIADAVSGFAADFMANFDPYQDQAKEKEFRLVEAQIANLNASTRAIGSQSFKVPTYRAGTREQRLSGKAGALSGSPVDPESQAPTLTNPWQASTVDPAVRDADAFEQRYGDSEIGSMLYGGYTWIKDAYHNLKRTYTERKPDPDAPSGWSRYIPKFSWSK
jgi:hypothetical protein